ncbi:TonB-dependent receptor [Glaciecola sp. KUL10]|uniref:TonB-dependent receptor n=1 Tax=Glaciecola sp. (strain KUL10) TaxID=2161813 RepID=UPI000D789352|nr:TonB-dependent receptor [Glaciecola sp. KUL10]GBL06126.1 TonB-dependent receptor:Cna B-type [Glaciecola sp. KUL10]
MKQFKYKTAALAVAFCIGVSTTSAHAKNIVGSLASDSGVNLNNVIVTVENPETGLVRTIEATDGDFRFPLLPAGQYRVTARKDGFQTVVQEGVRVGLSGTINLDLVMLQDNVERVEVVGSAISLVDVSSSSTGIRVDGFTLEKVPVPRDLTGVALLTPGATQGDEDFGNVASIGGASAAENAFYINGLNITNFRTGVGSSNPPFEMYESFEVQTGGYSAEFGRVTGSVINAKTKSGTNEFKWGANIYWEPDALREDRPSVLRPGSDLFLIDNTQDTNDFAEFNLWASGAIIEDTLFFYGLYNPRSDVLEFNNPQTQSGNDILQEKRKETDEDAFWAASIDWVINDSNILKVTAFSDKSETITERVPTTNGIASGEVAKGTIKEGGENYIVEYNSIISDSFSLSALYGVNKTDRTTSSDLDANPAIFRRFDSTGAFVRGGNFANFLVDIGDDKREVYRIDGDIYLDDHTIRFGIDSETLTANANTLNSGGVYYLIYVDDETDPANPTPYQVRRRNYSTGGSFELKNFAYYIQDEWQATENLVINAGLRNDSFENKNGAGDTFVELEDNWGLRLGAVYDVNGDGDSKVWASYGRYYLPVAANTNIRLSGAETFIHEFREFTGFADPTLDIPNFDGAITQDNQVFADGDVPAPDEIVDASLEPMYSDEFILGYKFKLNDQWSLAVQGTYRELATTIEDVAIDFGFNQYLEREFGMSCTECSGFHYYVLTNPGSDITITTDPDANTDGPLPLDTYTIPASDLNYPESIRKYAAIDINATKAWDGRWFLDATYTWSHSWGNNEGYIRSDNGQDDAGLTTLFDQPGLLDGAYGDLPNDRRHSVKIFGSYAFTEAFNLGVNVRWSTGRPKNAFGYHPTDLFAREYQSESFYAQGELSPRGSRGNTPSVLSVDLTASYDLEIFEDYNLTLRADVFNLLNSDTVTEINEIFDDEGASTAAGVIPDRNPNYGLPTAWQQPRSVRLSASLSF